MLVTSCGGVGASGVGKSRSRHSTVSSATSSQVATTHGIPASTQPVRSSMATPQPLAAFPGTPAGAQGVWTPAGRPVGGVPAVYETTLVPPGGAQPAGIAWMDTKRLSARLYSGSESPGGGPYRFTAPIQPAQATSLVAAFNGGFKMNSAEGGYYTEGRLIDPLVTGAASLVIYADGSVNIGAWGRDVVMTPNVVAIRQNLVPLVADGQPTLLAASADWQAWGATCAATTCSPNVPGIEYQWRSAVGMTVDGALVYASGPALDPLQLAELLVRAHVVRGMELDINPYWPVFATYDPPTPGGLATPFNGSRLLASSEQGPNTFFEPSWARDFVTLSTRSSPRA